MAEKTDRPKKASKRHQPGTTAKPAAKKPARKARKAATAAKRPRKTATRKPATKKSNRAKAVAEALPLSREELAARRIAGGQDGAAVPAATARTKVPSGAPVPAAANDGPPAAPGSIRPEAAGRVAESGVRGKAEPRARANENTEGGPRPNTLVPTNGIHVTKRRFKRKLRQNRWVMGLMAATLLGIVVLGEQTAPPDMTEFEQQIAASQAIETAAGGPAPNTPLANIEPNSRQGSMTIPGPEANRGSEQQNKNLSDSELVEIERLLARLDLGPSRADGVVDNQTQAAIRLYQKIAGLPVDGAPSRALLADIREVVKILEDGG